MKIDLANADLRAMAAAFAPAHLRIGGSEGDCIVYEISGGDCAAHPMEAGTFCYNNSDGSGFPGAFCLSMQRWDALVEFASATGLHIAFGLNAMLGRGGSPKTPMDTSNLRALLQRVHSNNASAAFARTIDFEFGNELEFKVDVDVYAADLLIVRALIDSIWGDLAAADRPRLIANDENPAASYWASLFPLASSAMHAASWHSYVGYGLDPTLRECADAACASRARAPNRFRMHSHKQTPSIPTPAALPPPRAHPPLHAHHFLSRSHHGLQRELSRQDTRSGDADDQRLRGLCCRGRRAVGGRDGDGLAQRPRQYNKQLSLRAMVY
jgi:hypothetical protein